MRQLALFDNLSVIWSSMLVGSGSVSNAAEHILANHTMWLRRLSVPENFSYGSRKEGCSDWTSMFACMLDCLRVWFVGWWDVASILLASFVQRILHS